MRAADLEAEWSAAQQSLRGVDALELEAAGLCAAVIMHMAGIVRVRVIDGCYEPDDAGKWAYISPVRIIEIGHPYRDWRYPWAALGGDLVDLISWDISAPDAWALRCGNGEWLGMAGFCEPTAIRRSPVDWLRHRCRGLVLLTQDRIRQYEILSDCDQVVAEDKFHADQLADALTYPYPRKPVFIDQGGSLRG